MSDTCARIPFRLRIGVTGHLELHEVEALEAAVSSILDQLAAHFAVESTPVVYRAVSPLAEGADRLVAKTILKREGADLVAPLPFPRERYLQDFASEDSRSEFMKLYAQAVFHTVVKEEAGVTDADRYRQGGESVVDHSDVLIALWDGLPPKGVGGTAAIVEYAHGGSLDGGTAVPSRLLPGRTRDADRRRIRRIPVFVVRTDRHAEIEQSFADRDWADVRAAFRALDHFNRFRPPRRSVQRELSRNEREWQRVSVEALRGQPPGAPDGDRLEAIAGSLDGWLLPAFAKADTGATSFRNRVLAIGVGTALLAAAAVAAAAARAVFAPHASAYTWVEVAFMAIVVVGWVALTRQQANRRWVALRALAELLRVMPYGALADQRHLAGGSDDEPPERHGLRPPIVQMEWYRRAADELWQQRPRMRLVERDVLWLRALIVGRWIAGQIDYHTRRSHQHELWHYLLRGGAFAAFAATAACAVSHALGAGGHVTAFLTIALPALGGALSYIEGHQEHGRQAERYRWTLSQLEDLRHRGEGAQHVAELRVVARHMLELMNAENADWAEAMWAQDIELAV